MDIKRANFKSPAWRNFFVEIECQKRNGLDMDALERAMLDVLNEGEGESVKYYNTKQAAALIGISMSRLSRALWDGRIDEPQRGPGNAFIWTLGDIDRASWQLCGKPLEKVEA